MSSIDNSEWVLFIKECQLIGKGLSVGQWGCPAPRAFHHPADGAWRTRVRSRRRPDLPARDRRHERRGCAHARACDESTRVPDGHRARGRETHPKEALAGAQGGDALARVHLRQRKVCGLFAAPAPRTHARTHACAFWRVTTVRAAEATWTSSGKTSALRSCATCLSRHVTCPGLPPSRGRASRDRCALRTARRAELSRAVRHLPVLRVGQVARGPRRHVVQRPGGHVPRLPNGGRRAPHGAHRTRLLVRSHARSHTRPLLSPPPRPCADCALGCAATCNDRPSRP